MAAMALEQKRAFTSKMLLGTVVRCRNKRNLAGGARRNDSRPKRRRMGTGMSHVKNAARLRALKKTVEQMNRDRVCYMTAVPRKELREGRVLVHNDATPQPKIRRHGFRAWTQQKTDRLIECHCDWAGVDLHGLPHYRVIG